jgi:N-acyl-phosphatidylethanolamine-hydrolysing phospholipase D
MRPAVEESRRPVKDAEHTRFAMAEVPTPSHHRPGGGFRNPWPNSGLAGFKDFLRWRVVERRGHQLAPNPARDALPRSEPAIVRPRAQSGYRSVTWVGHATLLLQLGSLNVLTDPVWSERASPFQWIGPRRLMSPGIDFDTLPPIDLVLVSHNHYDHLDATTVRRIARRFPDAPWLCPIGLARVLQSLGVRQTIERDWWERVDLPHFSTTCAPAQHFSSRGLGDRNDTLWCSWVIEAGGVRVFFAGDTALHPEFGAIATRLGPFDLVMLPIGAYEPRWFMRSVHMNPEDAVEAYRALADGAADAPPCLAIHWGTFRLTDEPVEEPPARFARRWREAGLPPHANWTLAHGETRQLPRRSRKR